MPNEIKIHSFQEIENYRFTDFLIEKVRAHIINEQKDYILNVLEDEYYEYLINKFSLSELKIDENSENVILTNNNNYRIEYTYLGNSELFKVRPNVYRGTGWPIFVDDTNKKVSFVFQFDSRDPEQFNTEKNQIFEDAFTNLPGTRQIANEWNERLPQIISQYYKGQINKFLSENKFHEAINLKINNDTKSVFTHPTIKKILIPKPNVSNNKEFSSDPTLNSEIYKDVLRIIYDSGKSMEKKPVLYIGKNEEGLRDQLLFILETRYEGVTASGETFNRDGKTDILLKYSEDGSNLFVAECKIWHGSSEFLKAVSQLFERYLTWRDSKVAVILFVKNRDFTNVLDMIKAEIKKHQYYVRDNGSRGESSFSYIFKLPQDEHKNVYLEVIAFHFDK